MLGTDRDLPHDSPEPVTSQAESPRRATATGRSAATLTTSVCGNARSTETAATDGRARTASSIARGSTVRRLDPSARPATTRTLLAPPRRHPLDVHSFTAKTEVGASAPVCSEHCGDDREAEREGTTRGDEPDEIEAIAGHRAETGRRRLPHAHAGAIRARSVPGPWSGIRRRPDASYACSLLELERPTNATSRSSSTPYCSRARRRASAISATQSALVARRRSR